MQTKQIEAQASNGNAVSPSLCDPAFNYVSSAATDVVKTFKRFGWKEPNRKKQRAAKLALNS